MASPSTKNINILPEGKRLYEIYKSIICLILVTNFLESAFAIELIEKDDMSDFEVIVYEYSMLQKDLLVDLLSDSNISNMFDIERNDVLSIQQIVGQEVNAVLFCELYQKDVQEQNLWLQKDQYELWPTYAFGSLSIVNFGSKMSNGRAFISDYLSVYGNIDIADGPEFVWCELIYSNDTPCVTTVFCNIGDDNYLTLTKLLDGENLMNMPLYTNLPVFLDSQFGSENIRKIGFKQD
ncbi:MAG: hypothetical protein IJJ23_10480 [Clostridia bacterium]|nr:hypothetical protein [Clostridia bacterium]